MSALRVAPVARPAAPVQRDDDGLVFRQVSEDAEFQACVRLQREIWGDGFTEIVPVTILRVAQYIGGITAGAFDEQGRLLGFVFGMTGLVDGELAHWSDMLAVRPGVRDRGIGRRLKLYQRDALLRQGIRTMYWTYDPLVAKNAYLNLVRLGARPVEYAVDLYGEDTGSALHAALGTDRFIVAWTLDAPPPAGAAAASSDGSGPVVVNRVGDDGRPATGALPDAPEVRVEVPPDIDALIDRDHEVAQAWRATTRRAFTWYLGRGYRVTGLSVMPDSGRSFYLLSGPEGLT